MAKIRDFKSGRLGAVKKSKTPAKGDAKTNGKPEPKTFTLDLANAPLYSVKFLESIAFQLKDIVTELKKHNLMVGDLVKMARDKDD